MTSATTVYVAPVSRGTGDGSSAANAKGINTNAGRLWLQTTLATWRTELDAAPTDVGINEPFTFRSVTPGFEPNYGDKSYITDTKFGVFTRRVYWLSDVGDYLVVAGAKDAPWLEIDPTMGPAFPTDLTIGATSDKPVRFFDHLAYRTSDGATAATVAGSTITRSVTLPHKNPTATWTSSANYTGGLWTGSTVSTAHTWTVNLPSPVRAVLRGNRTADPRTEKTTQQWCVAPFANSVVEVFDPNLDATEPRKLDGSGQTITMTRGQVYDPADDSVTSHTWTNDGPYAMHITASCSAFRGFEGQALYALISHFGTVTAKYQVFRDIRMNNGRYAQWRGDNKYDVEWSRVQVSSVAQKIFGPGQNCARWNFTDVYVNGELCVGDQYPTLFGAANGDSTQNAYNAGAFRFSNLILENIWGAGPVGGTYINGDGVDSELRGFAVRNYYVDLTPDGGIDCKPTPYWVNWPGVSVFNAHLSRNKRAFRSWPPAQDRPAVAPHVLRDVSIADARQYGLYMVGRASAHKLVDWHNPDGRANWTNPLGRTYTAVSNDGTVEGDMDAVIHQAHDARTGTEPLTSGMNTQTLRGVDKKPFRAHTWLPITVPAPLAVAVNGSSADDGTVIAGLSGTPYTFAPSGQPTGTVYTYTISGPGTISRSGDNATVTPTAS